VFDKLIQVLVFGCSYRRIADASCSATTLRRRRDEWITPGMTGEFLRHPAQLCATRANSALAGIPAVAPPLELWAWWR
jgi:hypothetical protein